MADREELKAVLQQSYNALRDWNVAEVRYAAQDLLLKHIAELNSPVQPVAQMSGDDEAISTIEFLISDLQDVLGVDDQVIETVDSVKCGRELIKYLASHPSNAATVPQVAQSVPKHEMPRHELDRLEAEEFDEIAGFTFKQRRARIIALRTNFGMPMPASYTKENQ